MGLTITRLLDEEAKNTFFVNISDLLDFVKSFIKESCKH